MSVLVDLTPLKCYEYKDKFDEVDENTCEICYTNIKDINTECKTCNKKICFTCFDTYDKAIALPLNMGNRLDEETCNVYHFYNCFFCRDRINVNLGSFDEPKRMRLFNKRIYEDMKMIEKYEKMEERFTNNYDEKLEDVEEYSSIILNLENNKREIADLKYKLQKSEDNSVKFENLMTTYNKNINDYNDLVNDNNKLQSLLKASSSANNIFSNDNNELVNNLYEINKTNKNKSLEKKINKMIDKHNKNLGGSIINISYEPVEVSNK